jgi:uncharacterized membrane protein
MKKIFQKTLSITNLFLISIIGCFFFLSQTNFAHADRNAAQEAEQRLSDLTERLGEGRNDPSTLVNQLPSIDMNTGIAFVIKTILSWAMLFTIIGIVVAAIFFLVSQGKEENITKAKDILVYLIIGMIIMASAYGIITGISQFDFFR